MTGKPNQSPDPEWASELLKRLVEVQELDRKRLQEQRKRRRNVQVVVGILGVYALFAAMWLTLNEDAPAWTSLVLAASNTLAVTSTIFFLVLEARQLRVQTWKSGAGEKRPSTD